MKFHELKVRSNRRPNRVGRGISAGQGKTAGRGTKGQNSRGSGTRPGFEGGQNPLLQRLPKLRGFTSHRSTVEIVYTGQLTTFKGTVDNFTLADSGLTSSPYTFVKVITKGELGVKIDLRVQAASKSAIAAVEKAGGSYQSTPRPQRSPKKPVD